MQYKNNHWIMRLIIGIIFISAIALIWASGLYKCFTFDQIKTNIAWLSDQVHNHYWQSVLVYLISYIILVVCGVPGVALMSIVGGFLFGFLPAVLYINIAAVIGAVLFFLLVRYLIGNYLQERYASKFVRVNQLIQQKGWIFLLVVRCIPIIPFFVVNIVAALTQISLFTFIWTTSVGILPTSLIFAYAGKQLNNVTCLSDLFSLPILSAFMLLVILIMTPIILNRYRRII
jgi:uncharacterized membrane protein YdjX (TVP38/TMEM64 family)